MRPLKTYRLELSKCVCAQATGSVAVDDLDLYTVGLEVKCNIQRVIH